MNPAELAGLIDHTALKPETTLAEIHQLCSEAKEHTFFSVCVNPYWIPDAKKDLEGSDVKVCTVVGFPLGANSPRTKQHEAADAIEHGAEELDMVINIGAALEGHWDFVEHEVHLVVSAASGKNVKVILETCLLSDEQIASACKAAVHGGAHFVKTSTGMSTGGASVDHIKLIKANVPENIGIKASGGIKTSDQAIALVKAGATRIGASASVALVSG